MPHLRLPAPVSVRHEDAGNLPVVSPPAPVRVRVVSDDDEIGDAVDYDSPYDGDTPCINCGQLQRVCRGNCDN